MSLLSVSHLTKRFGEFTAVDNVSFDLHEGEILGFLGPNGAGKTTTIQMLLGVLTPTAGRIAYFGKDLATHRSEALEHIGFSSTYTNLPWDLRVMECLQYSSYLYKIPDRRKRIAKIVDMFDLEALLKQQIKELSEGQKTRLNMAKAFLHFPKILLLDEPTASLDPDVAAYMREFLVNQQKKFNVSIMLTSHNMAEVEEVCDRVMFINHGKIIADDTPERLTASSRTSRVELLLPDKPDALAGVCRSRGLTFLLHGKSTSIHVAQEQIAELLQDLATAGVRYQDIIIDQPTLEEYFLGLTHTSRL